MFADQMTVPTAREVEIPTTHRFRTIRSSNYDVNNACNLTCEGCYYFVSGQKTQNKQPSAAEYDRFFAAECERGVNYPVFSGGEPSLNPLALRIAAKYWRGGIVYTNGVRRIPSEVPFRIAISVWGARARNERLRGAQSYDQAFETAAGDPRVLIYYTVTRSNIDDLEEVVVDCAAKGVPFSLQDFSMTTEYARLLTASEPKRNPYFRLSTQQDNLSLRPEDRLRIADLVDRLIDLYPETMIYSKSLNDWVHRSRAIHEIDPQTGVATDCAMLNASFHFSYGFDLKRTKGKECTAPEFDCKDCRVGPVATYTLLNRLSTRMRRSKEARREFLDLRELMMRFHFWDWPEPTSLGPCSTSV